MVRLWLLNVNLGKLNYHHFAQLIDGYWSMQGWAYLLTGVLLLWLNELSGVILGRYCFARSWNEAFEILMHYWCIQNAFFFLHSIDAVGLYTAIHGFDREWEFWCIIDAPVTHWECGLFYNYTALMARIMPVLTMCAGWCRSANAGVAGSQSCTFNQHVVLSCSWFGEQMLELGDSWEPRFQYEHVVLSFWNTYAWMGVLYRVYTVYGIRNSNLTIPYFTTTAWD